jgi:ketosteroid isomerase-like protein
VSRAILPGHPHFTKILLGAAVIVLMISGCRQPDGDDTTSDPVFPPAEELVQARAEVESVIDRFGRMWEDEDMATFSKIIAHDADLFVIGTDAAEQIVGYDEYERIRRQQFSSFENVEFDVRNRVVKLGLDARTAWFSEEFDLLMLAQGDPVSLEGLRLTGGLEKRGEEWVIVQLHTSVPVPGQAAEY